MTSRSELVYKLKNAVISENYELVGRLAIQIVKFDLEYKKIKLTADFISSNPKPIYRQAMEDLNEKTEKAMETVRPLLNELKEKYGLNHEEI